MIHSFFSRSAEVSAGLIDLEVWRMSNRNLVSQWGDIDETAPPVPIPALAGREKVMVVKDCVFEPRTTGIDAKGGHIDGSTTSKMTVFLSDPTVDLEQDDMFAIRGHNGKLEAWKLEGEPTTNNYVSPFTGIVGGREVFLIRVREMKNG